MIDLHMHILPGLDDGASTMEDAIRMARMAVECGVHTVAATPHCNIPGEFDNYDGYEYRDRLKEFRKELKSHEIPLKVCAGMEVYGTPEVPRLLELGRLATLNDSRYLLIEFPFEEDPYKVTGILGEILRRGYIPLIAHPERYYYVGRDPQLTYEWHQMGCRLQMNKGSVMGNFGERIEKLSLRLLDHQVIDCIASDAHSPRIRTPYMKNAWERLDEIFGPECPQILLQENPKRILEDMPVCRLRPYEFS